MAINLPKVPINLGPRMRRVLRYIGFAVFALVVFTFALQMTFPYGRVKDKIIEAMASKYDVTIGSVERGWMPGRVYFHAFSIRSRPAKPGDVVDQAYIDKLEVDVGILSLLGGTISVDFDATLGDRKLGYGNLSGSIAIEKFGRGTITASIDGDSLPSDAMPMRALLGLPMSGKLELDVDARLPVETSKLGKRAINWQKASASLSLACPSGCTFGDGKTKLKPLVKNTRNQAMVGDGIDFGQVRMDTLVAKVTMKKGRLNVDRFDTTSKDGILKIDYSMTLDKEFGNSMVAGCLRFKGSDELLRREPKTHAALSTTGAELRSDGLFHIRLTGEFDHMRRLNQECGPSTKTNNDEDQSKHRPTLTVHPDTPKPTGQVARPTPPTPTPPPPTTPTARDAGPASGAATTAPAPGMPGSAGELRGDHQAGSAGSDFEPADGEEQMEPPPPGAATPADPPPEE